ncbi:hypothetical protein [Fluviicola taffensis]|uniref:hypothetical protein n=1 Tax=Fluviicola taffensis TaxID=191579 RepID=UPI0031378729
MRFFTTCILISALFCSIGCKKTQKDDCSEAPSPVGLSSNGPVIKGWPLVLTTANYGNGYTYRWKGPNGWSMETTDSWDNYEPNKVTIDSASINDSGKYLVEIVHEGCIVERGSVDVEVTEPPLPPCPTANNSSTSTIGGIGGTTYSNISHSDGIYYSVYASGAINQTINFVFKGKPKPGMYLAYQGYHPSEVNQATVYIQAGFDDFFMESYYTIYVNEVNGKLQFAFCNANFTNPVSSSPLIISAKVTLP